MTLSMAPTTAPQFGQLRITRIDEEKTYFNKDGKLDANGKAVQKRLNQLLNDNRLHGQTSQPIGEIKELISDDVVMSLIRCSDESALGEGECYNLQLGLRGHGLTSYDGEKKQGSLGGYTAVAGFFLESIKEKPGEAWMDNLLSEALRLTVAQKLGALQLAADNVDTILYSIPEAIRPVLKNFTLSFRMKPGQTTPES